MTRNLKHIAGWGLAIAGGLCLFLLSSRVAHAQEVSGTTMVVTWTALISACMALVGLATFYIARGKAEQESLQKATEAKESAERAERLAQSLSTHLTEARIEFARDYATHRDMMASENRTADTINTMRTEIRSDMRVIMDRLDRWADTKGS